MVDHNQQNILNFFSAISPWKAAYTQANFSYVAERRGEAWHLVYGRLFLNVMTPTLTHKHIETENFRAGYFPLSDLKIDYRRFIERLAKTGHIQTPEGELILPLSDKGKVETYSVPLHQDGLTSGQRLPYLRLSGTSRHSYLESPAIDWELKSAKEPYDSLGELLAEVVLLGSDRSDVVNVEVVATQAIVIDFSSVVEEDFAYPKIFLAKSLDKKKCHIGYRVFNQGKVTSRGSIEGHDLCWSRSEEKWHGEGKLPIPKGAVLHCYAVYDGHACHQGWIVNAHHFQNSRRNMFEEFDKNLDTLRQILSDEKTDGRKNSREFELGVSLLLWMLGFSPAQAGGADRFSDSADIIAMTPKGGVLVVECTTGLLNPNNKLSKLLDRSRAVKKRLEASGYVTSRVLPVIITCRAKNEVSGDLEFAQKMNIAVITKEDLEEGLARAVIIPDTENIFDTLWESSLPAQTALEQLSRKAI